MCGVAGVLDPGRALGPRPEAERVVRAMTAALAHRGPDGEGLWSDAAGRCVLGHRRLSVIDRTETGRQPMVSGDGRWVASVNGEIYDFQELRTVVEGQGLRLRGRSDTEVLVNALALWQADTFRRLDGMFALAAFDTLTGELLLARDAFGEKPLYYIELPRGGLAFASELRALEVLPSLDDEVNLDAVAELLMFQYIGAPRTIYRSVRKLPPGHLLHAVPGRPAAVRPWFSLEPGEEDQRPLPALADELEDILVRSLRRRLVADVPVGAFLSGGVDSSVVCALARNRLGTPLRTFTIGFADHPGTEHHTARRFAEHLGLPHEVRLMTPDDTASLEHLGGWLDEPNADWSCLPLHALAGLAREHVTVALSGDGGDEMFAGYAWYGPLLQAELAGEGSAPDDAYLHGLLMSGPDVIARLFGEVPALLSGRLRQIRDRLDQPPGNRAFRLRRNEVENYLPGAVLAKVDRMSMQHALEVRTPFLQPALARFAARLPVSALYSEGRGKRVLREVAYRHLPRHLVDLPKSGFGIPDSEWAGPRIRGLARRILLSDDGRLQSCLGREVLRGFLDGEPDVHRHWTLALVESWLRHHRASLPAAGALAAGRTG